MKKKIIGVLAFHGDVREHIEAVENAAKKLRLPIEVLSVRTPLAVRSLDALILPGGESTTLHKLCVREGLWDDMKKVPAIFGTCAGAIMLAKEVDGKALNQETLGLMSIRASRNAYGRQAESFEETITTALGTIDAIFIRAPKIAPLARGMRILAEREGEVVACEEHTDSRYYLAATFHPELSSTLFHEHFLTAVFKNEG
jgi:5'-phosphate synthase pdxT subunit